MTQLIKMYANRFFQSEYKDRPELMEGWIMNEFKKDLLQHMMKEFSENEER